MKICFCQKQLFPYFGVMALSGILNRSGHRTDVLIYVCETDILSRLETISPDIIGFSVMSTEHKWLKGIVPEIKKRMPGVPIIVGGVHATLYPEDILKLDGVDYVCWGEGEIAFPRLLERLEKGDKSPEGIQGIGYRKGAVPVLQGVAPLIQDLSSFSEDREVYYDRYPELKGLPQKIFMSSRGCPFSCNFCANSYMKNIFRDAGRYIRRKPPDFFLNEIKRVVEAYGATSLFFCDDLFVFNFKWLEDFSKIYKSGLGIPYICTGRAGSIQERHTAALAFSGCHTVSIGVETGNEHLRQKVLNKKISNADLLNCSSILKKAGIEIQTSNMFCLPDETIEDAVSTIDLNIRIGTDYMFTAIFLPFPKTALAEYCIEKNLLKKDYSFEDMPESFVRESVLDKKEKDIFSNIHKIAHLSLLFPGLKPLFIFMAKKVHSKKLFFFLYLSGTFLRYKKERKLSFYETVKYLWSYRKGY